MKLKGEDSHAQSPASHPRGRRGPVPGRPQSPCPTGGSSHWSRACIWPSQHFCISSLLVKETKQAWGSSSRGNAGPDALMGRRAWSPHSHHPTAPVPAPAQHLCLPAPVLAPTAREGQATGQAKKNGRLASPRSIPAAVEMHRHCHGVITDAQDGNVQGAVSIQVSALMAP